jgi:hypothetical protein
MSILLENVTELAGKLQWTLTINGSTPFSKFVNRNT